MNIAGDGAAQRTAGNGALNCTTGDGAVNIAGDGAAQRTAGNGALNCTIGDGADATALCQTLVVVLFLRRAFSSQHFLQKGVFWNVSLPTWKTLLCCHEVTGQRANTRGLASFGRPAHSKTRTGPLFWAFFFSGPSSKHGFLALWENHKDMNV